MEVSSTRICTILLFLVFQGLSAQNLPDQWHWDKQTHLLTAGKSDSDGLYNEAVVEEIRLYFKEANYWTLLTQNYTSKKDLLASLKYKGQVYDSIGVRFKGQTSYIMNASSPKKSFNITMDLVRPDQKLAGYETLNLNNSFEDASFMREVFYYHNIRKHTPAAKANFIRLFINDQDWGIYQNVQQLNKDFLEEWWASDNGSNFRADASTGTLGGPGGGGPGGGPQWGDGTAALNYLGEDTTLYKKYYTLKSTESAFAWDELIEACMALNQTPIENLETGLAPYFDIDKILWHLASEVLFSDDDSYIFKGKMDYFLYRDAETGRISTYDYDGNSIMKTQNVNWSAFYNESKVNYPLMNRLLSNTRLRQRYLAHLRVLINEYFDSSKADALINEYAARINDMVQADPKKRTTYAQFLSDQQALKNFVKNRKANLLNNAEVKLAGPVIRDVVFSAGGDWLYPKTGEKVIVRATASHLEGISALTLYYSEGLYHSFASVPMYDNGLNGDVASGDGIFTGEIPGFAVNTYVRFYIEAAADNIAKTISYFPEGAEHDVLIYQVQPLSSSTSEVVINEFMASNTNGPVDENSQNEDWIELYNKSAASVNLGGYFMSDNPANIQKWMIPQGTVIPGNGYLIFWCDEDQEDGPLHTSFKLSAAGETIFFADNAGTILDSVTYGSVAEDLSMARIPNGTGTFREGSHTFNANNSPVGLTDVEGSQLLNLFPNPASAGFTISSLHGHEIEVYDILGRRILKKYVSMGEFIETEAWHEGVYLVTDGQTTIRLVLLEK